MTEYPQWLIERVAKGIYESPSTLEPEYEPSAWPPEHPDDAQHILDYAVGALDALGFQHRLRDPSDVWISRHQWPSRDEITP